MAVTQSYYYDTALGQAETQGWNQVILCHHFQLCAFPYYSKESGPQQRHIKRRTTSLLTGWHTHGNMKKKMWADKKTAMCLSREVEGMRAQNLFFFLTNPGGQLRLRRRQVKSVYKWIKRFLKWGGSTISHRNAAFNKQIGLWFMEIPLYSMYRRSIYHKDCLFLLNFLLRASPAQW